MIYFFLFNFRWNPEGLLFKTKISSVEKMQLACVYNSAGIGLKGFRSVSQSMHMYACYWKCDTLLYFICTRTIHETRIKVTRWWKYCNLEFYFNLDNTYHLQFNYEYSKKKTAYTFYKVLFFSFKWLKKSYKRLWVHPMVVQRSLKEAFSAMFSESTMTIF